MAGARATDLKGSGGEQGEFSDLFNAEARSRYKPSMMPRPARTILLALLLTACSSDPAKTPADLGKTPQDGSGTCSIPDGGAKNASLLVGTFQVSLHAATTSNAAYTSLIGKVDDGVTPAATIWEEKSKDGSCRLLTPRVPFCATSCGSKVCVEDDTCQAYPTAHSVGNVAVSGIHTGAGATSFSLTPTKTSSTVNYQVPSGTTLPYPAFSEGEKIAFAAEGGECFAPAFKLESTGIAPLVLADGTLTLDASTALKVTWTAAGQTGISKIHIKLDISHHGGSKGMVECDTDDTGSLDISASLISALLKLGVAGFPTIIVTRSATGTALIPAGKVQLVIYSEAEKSVTVPGVTSCNKDEDCEGGKKCQTDLTCK